jgi:hypothetical protein
LTVHGVGLTLWPALMHTCLSRKLVMRGQRQWARSGVGIHTLAMAATAAIIAVFVCEWIARPSCEAL